MNGGASVLFQLEECNKTLSKNDLHAIYRYARASFAYTNQANEEKTKRKKQLTSLHTIELLTVHKAQHAMHTHT